ncbi:MAG TPA: hypothetical protein P5525_24840 [Candidatus Paceibacterota bacterium]|nr:hypothetical protein [Candidatus Paceibacterota bacterium]
MPLTADRPEVTVAAFGDPAHNRYALHIVNRGNQRSVVLTGLPESVTAWRRFVTDAHRGMEEHGRVEVRSGTADFVLPPASFTTLLSGVAHWPRSTRDEAEGTYVTGR